MPFLILGLIFFWLFWMVWALMWLFWPIALVVGGLVLWRGQMRRWERLTSDRGETRRTGAVVGVPSGNSAFDEYRDETLRHIEEERSQFRAFLERLRKSKDKAEFDRFMADRRGLRIEGPHGAGA